MHTRADTVFGFVGIPAVEGTASHPCLFGPFPACSLDIGVEEVMCMADLGGKVHLLAAVGWSKDCWPCHRAASAS